MTIGIRPLRADDAAAAHASSFRTFTVLDAASGEPVPEHTDDLRRWGEARVAHFQRHDPDGAWAAVDGDDRLVGVALASRRGPLWFLSLLTVEPELQGSGIGRRLLDAALGTADDAPVGLICSSEDPRALRRYALAGFDLVPAYSARGTVDRSRLPAVGGVREGDWADDRELLEALAVELRGAPLGPDADAYAARARLLIADSPAGRGYAVARSHAVRPVAATTPEAARALLVTGLAELEGEVTVDFVTAQQQWAVGVLLELRMPFKPRDSIAVRAFPPALPGARPYLPDGVHG